MRVVIAEALKGRVYGPDDYVFLNKGKPYTHNALSLIFRRTREMAKYEVTLNEFGRHSWATQRLEEGWSFSQVSMFLLNSAEMVEKKYSNITPAVRKAIINLHSGSCLKKKNARK